VPLQDGADRDTVDAELDCKLLDLAPGLVSGEEFGLSVGAKALLDLLRRTLRPHRSRRLGPIEQRSEAFYVVREVRIGSDKVHSVLGTHVVPSTMHTRCAAVGLEPAAALSRLPAAR
jgi:hypothetical protein